MNMKHLFIIENIWNTTHVSKNIPVYTYEFRTRKLDRMNTNDRAITRIDNSMVKNYQKNI